MLDTIGQTIKHITGRFAAAILAVAVIGAILALPITATTATRAGALGVTSDSRSAANLDPFIVGLEHAKKPGPGICGVNSFADCVGAWEGMACGGGFGPGGYCWNAPDCYCRVAKNKGRGGQPN